jgi:hypothetical protein
MKHLLQPNVRLVTGLLALGLAATTVRAADNEAARTVFNQNKDAIVSVTAVLKVEYGGQSRDQEVETTGTVIGKDGLLVASATAVNPASALMENFESRLGGESGAPKPKISLTDVKYRMPDGTEIPARIVFRDRDLDAAFLVPDLKEGEKPPAFTSVDVQNSAVGRELDEIVSVTRLAKNMSYTSAVMLGHICAVVTKPRTVYDFATHGTPTTGCPVFNPQGKLIGLTLIHRDVSSDVGMMGAEIVVMPAAEIAGLVDQARKAAAKKSNDSEKTDKAEKK